ncbi:hypothetical protein HGRIS_007593 [Hohenbuehelia grisea]|uniref:non-specific serine/threonine protein kinase n=1 Tax=Hohenbuehelia grisea TaxID=104357 RepID=A0ABR3J5H7_9AGAR
MHLVPRRLLQRLRLSRAFSDKSTLPHPTTQHVLNNPSGKQVFSCLSEPLGLPAAEGYGFARFQIGDAIGPDQRYSITRKLGWGMHSSTWLAHDTVLKKYVAVKALTGHITEMYDCAAVWEADALRLLSYPPVSKHCVTLLDEFTVKGHESAGSHLCLVMPLYGGDVKALAASRNSPFPPLLAKRIIQHVLQGIAYAHERGVVHTDIKHDNVFFETRLTTAEIEKWINEDPSRMHPCEVSVDGTVQAAMSQPMKPPSEEEALNATYLLADFGSAQPSKLHANRTITAICMRAPEAYLGGEWDKPADIWSFGCLVYELLTSQPLFLYQKNDKFGLSEIENILYQMMLYTGEVFRAEQLSICPLASEYFNGDCRLKQEPEVFEWPLEHLIGSHKVIHDEEVPIAADFVRQCLRLNPKDRANAQELLDAAWLNISQQQHN